MKPNFLHRVCCAAAGMAAVLCLALPCAPRAHAEAPARVMRVPLTPTPGFSQVQPDGTRTGLILDYLTEIAKYTGWEYEYVDVSAEDITSRFLDGEFDLMGGTFYAPGFEQYFAYPDYSTGSSYATLLARADDERVHGYDPRELNGMTIGVYKNASEKIRRLEEFLRMNGLECPLRFYTQEDMDAAGTLYAQLERGEVDLLLGNLQETGDFRIAATFEAQPHYIVAQPGDQDALDGLNMALQNILSSDPSFAQERYAANFPSEVKATLNLTEAERAYVAAKGTVTVAVVEHWHPLFCLGGSEPHNGAVPDMLDQVAAFSGLEFRYVYADTYMGAIQLVRNGEADMLGSFLGEDALAETNGLALSRAYAAVNSIVVKNKSVNYPSPGLVCAALEGRRPSSGISAGEVVYYSTLSEGLAAVNRGEADFVYGLAASLERELQSRHYPNLVPVSLVNDRSNLHFALGRPVPAELLTILNKSISSLSAEQRSAILDKNLISSGTVNVTLTDLVYSDPVMFVGVAALLLVLTAAVVVLIARNRIHAAEMRAELEQAEAESKAKGEFLSRMSHEIRTPMNAVVGLTDLTSMMEGVPEAVQANLGKIRSSSHYLLGLINDILDMSRIDSGMLTIGSEPFSLGELLQDLESMMHGEAERRSIAFRLDTRIQHDGLCGDAIRLRQVLTNLLSNAFKFTPAGGHVELQVTETGFDVKGAAFLFCVTDDGVGVAPGDQERIFGSFEQLGSNFSRSQGTGLGLPISRSIVRLMGGELALESAPGKGSRFHFALTLPLAEARKAPPPASADLLRGARLLLAEDNDLNAEIAIELLALKGALVTRAENGRQAVDLFAASEPGEYGAVLMDIQMPELNGLDAARAIRALPRPDAPAVPIIAMTANSFREDTQAAAAAGMTGFIPKPVDASYLYSVLCGALGRTQAEDQTKA
ncbi:ATP-binding protein [Allofournierella sp.]|uniref:ATP-binding protein n=1 Tax=Allofournierella sp. TaxID=1940256 RepID=UPI003AB613CF